MTFFTEPEKNDPKIYVKQLKTQNYQNNPKGKITKVGGITHPGQCYKDTLIKQYNIATKTDIWISGAEQRDQK